MAETKDTSVLDVEAMFESKPDVEEKKVATKRYGIQQRKYACTIVNLLPMELNEDKPHMLPSSFKVPAATKHSLGLLHVEEGIHYVPNPLVDDGKPNSSIKQITMPDEMARSIVEDYASAQVALGSGATPGIFYVSGRLTEKEVRELYPDLVEQYTVQMKKWFHNLCALADADWNRNHNMLAVSDLQRMAAKYLGINKEWVEFKQQENAVCKFCTVFIPVGAIVCPNCKNILDDKAYTLATKGKG